MASFTCSSPSSILPIIDTRSGNLRCTFQSQVSCGIQRDDNGRRVWRRRTLVSTKLDILTKKDDMLRYKMQRVPFVEEQVRKIREVGKVMTMDIEQLLLREDNRFEFVNSVAAEATEYVDKNRDEYGGSKKAIFHVLSNRVNDLGFDRPEAYVEADPYKPGPGYLLEYYT
ncbi:plastid transcriptionally active7 [Arabidopsis thaliana]|uniref:Isoform 2 of Protein PLASTID TRANSCRIPTIONALLY ACTIVE 7 n=1 Tax=Arabidopsis thaliana TaxID=3702 RepID=Q8VZV9-2|nr:plastid transcriptionally active7 [Arabidopsis thaliana]AED93288.1 plastid transcriptionally active7 [Arabidopsis thaliana]|eukprot:NP_001190379.1 plastid transcriptionally active7 [Arabidopsis thaliana]